MRYNSAMLQWALLSLLHASLLTTAFPQQKRIYIANDDHTDLMWASDEAGYRTAWNNMLDYYLDQADRTDTAFADFQGRFNTDGSYWVWTYEHSRTPAQFQRLISRIRDGHITVPLQLLVLLYGGMPTEGVLRSMYYSGRLERRYDLRFELVSAMENATLSYGLPSLWAGAGAKYSWKGVCGCYTAVSNLGSRGREIYNATGPDGRSILMKWHSFYPGNNQHSGGYAENRAVGPAAMVDFATTDPTFISRQPFPNIVGLFGWGWDDLQSTTETFITAARSRTTPTRRVVVSNELDFFNDYTASVPPGLIPSYSASFGNDWDCNVATMAEVTASVKRAVEELRPAEALATIVSGFEPSFMTARAASRDTAFNNIGLYFEHNWNNDGAYTHLRPAFNRAKAAQVIRYVGQLKADAVNALGRYIPKPTSSTRFFVFNPLSWTRTDYADIALAGPLPVRVVDVRNGQEVRSQVITKNSQQYLRILAENVPSMGYRAYEIQSGQPAAFDSAVQFSNGNTTFENSLYRVTVNSRAAITSLIEKGTGNREWCQSIGGRTMNDLGSGSGTPVPENVGPVSATLRIDASSGLPHTTRITLFKDRDRVEIENAITANFFGDPPVYYGFGVNITGQTTRHEEVGAMAVARLTTQGGNYSSTTARYEYLTMNHFVDVSNGTQGITLSNWDSQFFQLGNSTLSSLDVSTPQIKAIVGGKLAPATNGFGGQNGDSYFLNRYAMRAHGTYDQAAAMRFSLEHQNPFVAGYITASSAALPDSTFSFLSISNPNVLLWALKPAEEGISDGIIARVWNLSSSPASFDLTFAHPVTSAFQTTHVETNTGIATVIGDALSSTLPGQQMQTYRVFLGTTPTNIPPTVTLTSPANGSTFTAPASIALAASASDSDGTVTRVEFFRDSIQIGSDTTAPYSVTWDSVNAGVYSLTAKAFDNVGASRLSTPVSVVVTGGQTTLLVAVNPDWNLVSLPLLRDTATVSVVFPSATAWWMYQPLTGYEPFDTLEVGRGYWMKFPSAEAISVRGTPFPRDTIPVVGGWNIIGSTSVAFPAAAVTTIPSGVLGSPFYVFANGYDVADTLRPGGGYWIKCNGPGGIVVGPDTAAVQGHRVVRAADLLTSYNALRIVDASGKKQTLYFVVGASDSGQSPCLLMPPPAPQRGFDARFASDNLAEMLGGRNGNAVALRISSARYPLTLSWRVASESPPVWLSVGGADLKLERAGELSVADPEAVIRLKVPGPAPIPLVYALDQNFPNPFNPRTRIGYALPFTSSVRMIVYDLLGQRVATVVEGVQEAGFRSVEWDARNDRGQQVASGVYLLRFEAAAVADPAESIVLERKMVVLR